MTDVDAVLRELGIDPALPPRRGLARHAEAEDLVRADVTAGGREILLQPAAAAAWSAMKSAAAADGVTLLPVSGFRSVARQAEVVRERLARGETVDAVLRVLAPPGYSEHHTGRALDVSTPGVQLLQRDFAGTAAFRWLCAHAPTHGFHLSYPEGNASGYQYEPWHWCLAPPAG